MLVLVTGPVRAGKSTFALGLARASGKTPVYVATAALDPSDAEMAARVERHRAERAGIRTVEAGSGAPGELTALLGTFGAGEVAVIDSLGSWFGALLLGEEERAGREPLAVAGRLHAQATLLQEALAVMQADAIVVAEETGWGMVPLTPVGRIFRDELGRTTARLARAAAQAYLVVAGYAIDLKRAGRPVSE